VKIMNEDRKTILLQATLDILRKCEESPYTLSPLETTAHWDEADCDGYCLMGEIEDLLESEEA